MSAKDDGGPAFPCEVDGMSIFSGQATTILHGGMTLRDWFAGQALAGFSANPSACENWTDQRVAEASYRAADAMLAERRQVEERER